MLPWLSVANARVDDRIGTDTERNIGGWTFRSRFGRVSLVGLELVSGDGLFVGVLAFQCVYNCYYYSDGRYESHCEEDQWVSPWGACEEAADHCLADAVEDV